MHVVSVVACVLDGGERRERSSEFMVKGACLAFVMHAVRACMCEVELFHLDFLVILLLL
jgi:hypothetical protein